MSPVIDEDDLGEMIDNWDSMIEGIKLGYGNVMKNIITAIFEQQGPMTINTNPLDPRLVNLEWDELAQSTIDKKGSSTILIDTRKMLNFVKFQIEDSDWDDLSQVLKFGWFEDSGDRAYIAAIHEFGLTGTYYQTDDGNTMGAQPIRGRIVIPERSMLRKLADMIVPQMEKLGWSGILHFIREIKKNRI